MSTSGNIGLNASGSVTNTDAEGVTYTNSHLDAKNITIKSKEDTTVRGGVVTAEERLDLEVGGNLTVESLQDRHTSSSTTIGISGGAGGSEGSEGVNSGSGGANFNISRTDKSWVEEQTSLSGGSVNIYVENKTTLTGAVIASTTGDLVLDTGSFEYNDIKDKDISYNIGGGINAGSSSSSVSGDYGFSDTRQTNFATVGEGTIIVRDEDTDLSKLNRDVSISQYGTKEGGLQGGFTVDTTLIDTITSPVETLNRTLDQLEKGYDAAKETTTMIAKEVVETIEKAGNYVEYGHFVTDNNVAPALTMDKYEEKIKNGDHVSASETVDYYAAKINLGIELTQAELIDFNAAAIIKQQELARFVANDILSTWKDSSASEVNDKLEFLRQLDHEAAKAMDGMFRNIREVESRALDVASSPKSGDTRQELILSEKDQSVRDILQGFGNSLNTRGAEINRSITNSTVVQSTHEFGAYLNANPGDALALGFTGGLGIAVSPFIIGTAPAVSGIVASDKTKDAVIGATLNTAAYVVTTNSEDRTFSGYASSAVTGAVTGLVVSPLTNATAYGIEMNTTTRFIGGAIVGGSTETANQLIQNNGDISKINVGKIVYTGTMTGLTTTLGGLQADKLIKPNYLEAAGLANMTTFIPTLSGHYVVDSIQKDNEKKSDK